VRSNKGFDSILAVDRSHVFPICNWLAASISGGRSRHGKQAPYSTGPVQRILRRTFVIRTGTPACDPWLPPATSHAVVSPADVVVFLSFVVALGGFKSHPLTFLRITHIVELFFFVGSINMTHLGILFSSCRSFQNGTGTDRKAQ
jgi:hypothetical protein